MTLQVRNLRKVYPTRFGEKVVLDGVNFDLAMGERLGILGRNGAGKSTMIRVVSGAERPTQGSVRSSMSISWPLAFGGAFQPNLTGLDNIRFITRMYGQNLDENIGFVEEFAELGPYLNEEVRTYSSGMRARLAFAISMIIEFDCFLIDEVNAVGDARFHDRCNRELFRKRSDRAMIIISHDASYIRDHCNRFAVLHNGHLELFDEFEAAYTHFRETIDLDGLSDDSMGDIPNDRRTLIENTHLRAVTDDAFRVAVQSADWKRDDRQWDEAEAGYLKALELYPFQRSYWVQMAHCAKERGKDKRAEIGYRTAIALGEPYDEVREHLEFVIKRQGLALKDYPAHLYSGCDAACAAPAASDIRLLAWAAWGLDDINDTAMLTMLREYKTCNDVLAAMLCDDRFYAAQTMQTPAQTKPADNAFTTPAANLIALSCSKADAEEKREIACKISHQKHIWRTLRKADGFAGWDAVNAHDNHASINIKQRA